MMADSERRTDQTAVLLAKRKKGSGRELPAVEEFFRTLSQRVRARLVNRVGSNFQVRTKEVTVQQLGDVFGEDMANGVFGMLRFDAPRIPGPASMERGLLTGIIGAMLGDEQGLAEPDDGEEERPLSIVEQRIAERIFMDLATDLALVWPIQPGPSVVLDGAPGSSRVVETGSVDEDVYVGRLEFGPLDDPYGTLITTIPVQVLRGLESKDSRQDDERSREVKDLDRVMPIELEMVAEMARIPMRVRDLRSLRVGDLIPLGPMKGALLRINGKNVMLGEPGHSNGQRSVRVIKRIT
jgi:flagellar motor switch protein FliM